METAVLDTHVVSYFVAPPREIRIDAMQCGRELRRAVAQHRLHVLTPWWLLGEVIPTALGNHALATEMLQLIHDIGNGLILHRRQDCVRIEAMSARPCDAFDLIDWDASASVWRDLAERGIKSQLLLERNRAVDQDHLRWVRTWADRVTGEYEKHATRPSLSALTETFEADADALVGSLLQRNLGQVLSQRGRAVAPCAVPTLRAWVDFGMAFRNRVLSEGMSTGKKAEGDAVDQEHYAAAAHADVLVTDESRFRRIVEAVPASRRKPEILRTIEFVQRWAPGAMR